MTTRRELIAIGLGLAAIIAAGKAPASVVKSAIAARSGMLGATKHGPYDYRVEYIRCDSPVMSFTLPSSLSYVETRDGKWFATRTRIKGSLQQIVGALMSYTTESFRDSVAYTTTSGLYVFIDNKSRLSLYESFVPSVDNVYDIEYGFVKEVSTDTRAIYNSYAVINGNRIFNYSSRFVAPWNRVDTPVYIFYVKNFGAFYGTRTDEYVMNPDKSESFNQTLRDVICVVKDGIPCLYDRISGDFYFNTKSGPIFAGPRIDD